MSKIINKIKGSLNSLWKKGAFHILFGNFLTKFAVFFGSIFLVRALSKSSYGMLGLIENIYGYIYLFAGMGLANAILRFVVLAKDVEEEIMYYRYVLRKGTIFNTFLIIAIGLIFLIIPLPEEYTSIRWCLTILILALPFQFLVDINIFTYRAKLSNKIFALITFLTSAILIYSKYFGALKWDISGVIIATVIANFIFSIILCFVTYKLYFKGHHPKILHKTDQKKVNRYSYQYMITNGVWAIFMLNDIFLLGIFGENPSVIADYKVSYVLPGNLAIISGAIGIFVAPYFVKRESDFLWVRKSYTKVVGISALLVGTVVLIMIFFAEQIITLLYGQQYENVVPIMRLLLIAAFINSAFRYTTANLLSAMGQIKANMLVSITGVFLQIVLNILLIPHYGALGVAFTSIFVYTIMAIALFIIFMQKYKIK